MTEVNYLEDLVLQGTGNCVFQEEWYARKEWLCDSDTVISKDFYWTRRGYTDMHNFPSDCKDRRSKHERFSCHKVGFENEGS